MNLSRVPEPLVIGSMTYVGEGSDVLQQIFDDDKRFDGRNRHLI